MSFLTELKRRKVFRAAVVYAATAFVVLEAAVIMLPRLGVPAWALSLIVLLVVLGFPVALVLAWALELTPAGIRVTATSPEPAPGEPPPSLPGRRTVVAAALLIAAGIGLGAGWVLRPASGSDAATGFAKSIAVLPFDDFSPGGDQAWFADGLAEKLLIVRPPPRPLPFACRRPPHEEAGR